MEFSQRQLAIARLLRARQNKPRLVSTAKWRNDKLESARNDEDTGSSTAGA